MEPESRRKETTMDDIYSSIGTAKHRVDIWSVIAEHFPTHESFLAWRASGHCAAGVLVDRDDLGYALIEKALRRGGRKTGPVDGVVEFDLRIQAESFRAWCRPE
jgi:hypothetical protein